MYLLMLLIRSANFGLEKHFIFESNITTVSMTHSTAKSIQSTTWSQVFGKSYSQKELWSEETSTNPSIKQIFQLAFFL